MTDDDTASEFVGSNYHSPTSPESSNRVRSIGEVDSIEYNQEVDGSRASDDAQEGDSPQTAIGTVVTPRSGTDPGEMDAPLGATIDSGAIGTPASGRGTATGDLHVTVPYYGDGGTSSDHVSITVHPQSATGISPPGGSSYAK